MMIVAAALSAALAVDLELAPGDDIRTLTESLGPGDRVVFAAGTYTLSSELRWSFSGTLSEPVVLMAAEGADVTIKLQPGEDGDYPGQVVYIGASDHIRIEGLHFTGSGPSENYEAGDGHYGVQIDNSTYISMIDVEVSDTTFNSVHLTGNNSDILLEGVHLRDTDRGRGIWAGCSDGSCWLSDSVISNSWIHGIRGGSGGIYLSDGSQGVTIEHTVIHDVDAEGVRVGATFGGVPNVLFGNAIWNVVDTGINARGGVRIQNNLIFDVDGDGIHCSDVDGVLDPQVVSFNTIVDTTQYAVELKEWWGQEGLVFANNALCNPLGLGLYYGGQDVDTGEVETSNLFSGNIVCGYVDAVGLPEGTFAAGGAYYDYTDIEGWDLYPALDSSLVDAADPSGDTWIPDTDFNGAPREGDAPDVGAYEWSGADNPGWRVREGFKEQGYSREAGSGQVGGCCSESGGGQQVLLFLPLVLLGAGVRRRS